MKDSESRKRYEQWLTAEVARRLNGRFGEREPRSTTVTNQPTYLDRRGIGVPSTAQPMRARAAVPKRLYKYMKLKYAESMVQRGGISVGTLHGYRDIELGPGIADPEEGKKTLHKHVDYVKVEAGSSRAKAFEAMGVIKMSGSGSAVFEDCGFTSLVDHHDAHVWCCSRIRSQAAMSSLDQANACVEIFDVQGFFAALSEAMKAHVACPMLGPTSVIYGERSEEWNMQNFGVHPVFLKGRSFEAQQEVRVAWIPQRAPNEPLQRITLQESGISAFCRIVDL